MNFTFFQKMGIVFFILAGFFIWLTVVTVIMFIVFRYFKKLSLNVDRGNLVKVIEQILEEEKLNTGNIAEIKKEIIRIREEGNLHLQKVGFSRFNPFEELGGDHSFAVALLDGRDSGIVITGLHTRERTRIYVKDIKLGKSSIELSREEQRVVRLAQKVS